MNRSTYYPYWKYNNYRQDANERLAVHIAMRNHHYSTAWDRVMHKLYLNYNNNDR